MLKFKMLSNNGEKHSQCPCCKACADCSDLKKTVEGPGAGLLFYQQTPQTQLSKNTEPVKTTSTDDLFVLQHTKDKKFVMFGHLSTQELQNIDCLRCKYIIKHAEKRLQTTGYIDKKSVIGVCDHCRKKNNLQSPWNECEDIVKKFITRSNEKSDNFEQKRRTWLAKDKHLHKDASIDAGISDTKIESSAHLQSHPSKLQGTIYNDRAFSKVEDPKIKIRLIPIKKVEENEINISKANIKKVYRTRSLDSYLQRLENASNLTVALKSGKRYGSKSDRIMSPVKRDYDPYSSDSKYTRKPDQKKILDIQDFDTYHPPDKKYISKSNRPTLRGARDHDPFYQYDEKYLTKGDVRKFLDTGYYDIHYREDKKYVPEPGSRAVTDVNEYTSHDQRHGKQFVTPFDEDTSLQQIYSKGHPLDTKKPINTGQEKDKKKQPSKSVKLTLGDTSVLTGSIYRARSETSMLDLEQVSVPKRIFKSATELYGERKPNIDFMKSDDYIEHYVSSTLPRQKTGKEKKITDMTSVYSSPNKKYTSEEALSTQSEIILKKNFSYQFPKEIIPKKELKRLRTSAELIQETQDMLNVREEEKKQRIEIERTKKLLEQEIKNKAREEKKRLQEKKRKEEEEQKRKAEEEKKIIEEENRRLDEERRKEEEKQIIKAEKNKKEDDRVKAKEKTKTELSEEEKLKSEEDKEKAKIDRRTAKEERKNALEEKRREKEESREKAKSEKVDKEKEKADKEKERADKEADKLKKQKEKEIQFRMQKEEKQREKEEKERLKKEKEQQLHAEKARLQGEKEDEQKNKQTTPKKGKSDNEKISVPESKQPNIETQKDKQKEKDGATADDFKKIRHEFNSKDEALKRKKEAQLEKSARDEADNKEKEIEKQAKIHGKEAKAVIKPEPVKETIKNDKKNETPIIKELDIKQIKVRKPSYDDLILRLVKLKQSEPRETVKQKPLSALDVPVVAREHKKHKYTKASKCIMCIDSEFELDVESILLKTDQPDETIKDIIIGQKIFKYKPPLIDKEDKSIIMPSLFQSTFQAESAIVVKKEPEIVVKEEPELKPVISVPKSQKLAEQDPPKGIIRYALSDRTFIEKGWTMLPTEKVVRKMNVYRMRPAHPEFDWFEHNKKKKLMLYDTGEKLADFDEKGRSRLYYRNGRLALDYYDAEEINAQQRFVVFSSGELDERGRTHPITILATFDYLGNGIVFDHGGKIRLKYNQTEGVILDRGIGPVSHWKWHTLNDPPVLQQVMIDTQVAHKDPDIFKMGGSSDDKSRADNEEMLAIEFDNFIKEKSKKLTQTFKPFQIKMKALKINDNFSLKILDQATIYLIFRDGTTNVKLNLGMILDHKEIVDTDTAEVGEVSNNLERFPARTESLAGLQRSVAYAQRFERARMERERRLRPPEPCTSADQLTAASTRPLRPPLRTAPSSSTANASSCKCSRKPCSSNVYYDTRLI